MNIERNIDDAQIIGEELVKQLIKIDFDICSMDVDIKGVLYKIVVTKKQNNETTT
jgi:hypothetical protein